MSHFCKYRLNRLALFAVTDFSRLSDFLARLFTPHAGDDWIYYLRNYGISLLLADTR